MAMYSYWQGGSLAKVSTATVPVIFSKANSLAFMNAAFATWRNDMSRCISTGRSKAKQTLENMGRTRGAFSAMNPMISIKNLWDAFEHYDSSGSRWRDTNSWSYNGGRFNAGYVDSVPWALVTFANAYDANLAKIAEYARKHQEAVRKLKGAVEGKQIIPWEQVNGPLKLIDEYSKAVDPLLVMCPERQIMKGYSWTKNIASFTGAMDDVLKETAASGSVRQGSGVVALAFIVSKCVPAFGDLYAEAIKGVPNAIRFFEDIKWERNHMMAQVYGSQFRMYER